MSVFFTEEDERARIKGSVDPLGLMAVWSAFGRQIVANLTTVTGSVRGFSIILIGRYLAADLVTRGKASEDQALSVFLRFEQMAAYVREHAHSAGGDVRGIERVRKYTRELNGVIPIGNPKQGEILSQQKTYGIWGLYTVSARESGLLPSGPVGLEPVAQRFVEQNYLPTLKPVAGRLERLLLRDGETLKLKKTDAVYSALAKVLSAKLRAPEREFFAAALRDVTHGEGDASVRERQAACARLMIESDLADPELYVDRAYVTQLAEAANSAGHSTLALRLRKILELEGLIAPADRLFQHLCARHGWTPLAIAEELNQTWQSDPMPSLTPSTWRSIEGEFRKKMTPEVTVHAARVADGFVQGDWVQAIDAVLAWNNLVMQARRGTGWVGVADGKLDVRYRGNEGELPSREELPDVWRNSYFLATLKDITAQLEVA